MDRKKLLIGVCCIRHNPDFFLSMYQLLRSLDNEFRVSVLLEKDQTLPEAQNKIAEYFMANDFEYLLWLEDDHYGHTADMVRSLISCKADIASMKYYSNGFPYPCVHSIKYHDYVSEDRSRGFGEVDLTGFGMNLMTRKVFETIPRPWFRGIKDSANRLITDLDFCVRAKAAGIGIIGCWEHCLPHNGITQENVEALRDRDAPSYIDRFLARYKKES